MKADYINTITKQILLHVVFQVAEIFHITK